MAKASERSPMPGNIVCNRSAASMISMQKLRCLHFTDAAGDPRTRLHSIHAWQDSQPVPPGSVMLSLDRCACGLAGNARVICVWHWKQAWLPTKCAPGISSGATTARFAVVEQEIRNSAAPAATPAANAAANVCFDFTDFAVARRAGSSPRRP